MKPALTLEEQEEWQKCFCCVNRKETKEKEKQARCDVAGLIATLPIMLLGASCGMAAGMVVGGRVLGWRR